MKIEPLALYLTNGNVLRFSANFTNQLQSWLILSMDLLWPTYLVQYSTYSVLVVLSLVCNTRFRNDFSKPCPCKGVLLKNARRDSLNDRRDSLNDRRDSLNARRDSLNDRECPGVGKECLEWNHVRGVFLYVT